MTTTAPRTTPMMITAALVRPARCSRSARASARFACSRSALLGLRDLAHSGGGTRGPRIHRPPNGCHLGPPNRQFHDKLSRLYGSFGSSIGHLAGERLLNSEYEAVSRGHIHRQGPRRRRHLYGHAEGCSGVATTTPPTRITRSTS